MRYLLDTNVLIALTKEHQGVKQNAILAGLDNCSISEITLAELLYGAYKGGFDRHQSEIAFFKDNFKILPIGPCLNDFGKIKSEMWKKGKRIDNFDLLIAATAITSDLTLVTHNTKHFKCIPGLTVIDWEQE